MRNKIIQAVVAILSVGYLSNAVAEPNLRLAYVSNSLAFSTQQLVGALRGCAVNSRAGQDAQTLADAAAHFYQEVNACVPDLSHDFQTLNQIYYELRTEIASAQDINRDRNAMMAWYNVGSAFIDFRQAYLGHGDPSVEPGHGHGGHHGGGHHGPHGPRPDEQE